MLVQLHAYPLREFVKLYHFWLKIVSYGISQAKTQKAEVIGKHKKARPRDPAYP